MVASTVRRRALATAANLVGVVVFGALVISSLVPTGHRDFELYYYGGRVERHGSYTDTNAVIATAAQERANPTRDDVFGAPTLVALVFQPLSYLKLTTALRVWLVGSCLAVLLAFRMASPRLWGVWAGALAAMVGFHAALRLAQASVLILALLVAAWAWLRRERDVPAGIALATAISFKIFPAFLLVPLVAHRRWRALRAVAVTLAVLGVLTVAALTPKDVSAAVHGTTSAGLVYPSAQNESFPGALLRATDSQTLAKIAAMALTVLAAYVLVRRPARLAWATYAIAVPCMLVAQTIAWDHYFPMTLVAFLALAAARPPVPVIAGGVAAFVLIAQSEPISHVSTDGPLALLNSPPLLGTVLLAVLLVRTYPLGERP